MPSTYKYLTNIILNQIQNLNGMTLPPDKQDWINPTAANGRMTWQVLELEVLDYNQNLVTRMYRIHSDAKIPVINQVIQELNQGDLLIMAPGKNDGESLSLLSKLNQYHVREALPGFYIYLNP